MITFIMLAKQEIIDQDIFRYWKWKNDNNNGTYDK